MEFSQEEESAIRGLMILGRTREEARAELSGARDRQQNWKEQDQRHLILSFLPPHLR